ncbi:MAG: FHA domain-containing protein [Paludibacteraceae bacterium]|nr:FHA domain-containing protein [Paludibacteraceae bacterium]
MKEITIGRNQNCTIMLEDEHVSRRHCRCFEDNGEYFIEDTKSLNGVKVDEEYIAVNIPTPFTAESKIKIGNKIFTGKEIIDIIKQPKESTIDKCNKIEKQYLGIIERYNNNLNLIKNSLKTDYLPYSISFNSKVDEISFYIEEYSTKMHEAITMLKLISQSSRSDSITFREDMDKLAQLCLQAGAEKKTCSEIKERVFDEFHLLQQNIRQEVVSAFGHFSDYYDKKVAPDYETCKPQSQLWDSINNTHSTAFPYVLYGYQDLSLPIFEDNVQLRYWQFLPFVSKNNLIIRYRQNTSKKADDIVNNLAGRLLASSRSQNVEIYMFDIKNLNGTSNYLKMLNRDIYTIGVRTEEVRAHLSFLDRDVENTVQNLLQGPYSSIHEINAKNDKQWPIRVVVFRDFPYGITQDVVYLLNRILINGIRAGVQFIFMLNTDLIESNEDCSKIERLLHLNDPSFLQATEIDLTKPTAYLKTTQNYVTLSDNILYKIIEKVKNSMIVKEDEILLLTDYMLPREQWWNRNSSNSADIPFGLGRNKKIKEINFTQESGQNAAVVIGIPGSGKSVFLHSLIANAAINYSPRELQLYLLDFSGVEFDVYARHHLPHARIIAPEAEREFGLSVLEEVYQEGNRRMVKCRENNVNNIVGLRQKTEEEVPRLLVIIDEFQKIFEINDYISKRAEKIIEVIIREYRKFGINLILASQELPGGLKYNLIANRVVFKSTPKDFATLLPKCNDSKLWTGDCIYNNASGADDANQRTRSFYINAFGDLEKLLDDVLEFADEHQSLTSSVSTRVFRAKEVPYIKMQESFIENHPVIISPDNNPSKVKIYIGENIAIQQTDVALSLTKGTNQNILIIGGSEFLDIPQNLTICMSFTQALAYNTESYFVSFYDFLPKDSVSKLAFEQIYPVVDYSAKVSEICRTESEVLESLNNWKEFIEERRTSGEDFPNIFLYFLAFEKGNMFNRTSSIKFSECSKLLQYILENGPLVGVFTILQVDNYDSFTRQIENMNPFNHRILFQMSATHSNRVISDESASRLSPESNDALKHRAIYYNKNNNTITKFKPYMLWQKQ